MIVAKSALVCGFGRDWLYLRGHGARVSFAECDLLCALQARFETVMSEISPFPQRVKSTFTIFRRTKLNFFLSLRKSALGIPLAAGTFFLLTRASLAHWVCGSATALSSVSVVTSWSRCWNRTLVMVNAAHGKRLLCVDMKYSRLEVPWSTISRGRAVRIWEICASGCACRCVQGRGHFKSSRLRAPLQQRSWRWEESLYKRAKTCTRMH